MNRAGVVVSTLLRARIIRNPTRKRGISECLLAYASGCYCEVFWEKQLQPLFTKQLPVIAAEFMNNPG